jgi:uncharacterized repeat protein (TIGR04138 family)
MLLDSPVTRSEMSVSFHDAVHEARQRDPRYPAQAYAFLCQALEHTTKKLKSESGEHDHHVTGQELLVGFRELALQEFGPLAFVVMREWGIQSSEDVGNMVYNFIAGGFFGRNESDRIEDFSDGVPLEEALKKPFEIRGNSPQ